MDKEQRKGGAVMEKSKKSKRKNRIIMVVAIILTAAISIGLTYAWFTSRTSENLSVTMGNLKIGSEFELDMGVAEPGITTDLQGVISNEGSIGVLIKMDMSPTTKIMWDSYVGTDGRDVLTYWRGHDPIVIPNDPNVQISAPLFNDDVQPYYIDEDGFYMWWKDTDSDDYYLLIEGEMDVDVLYELALDGQGMGNKYQDAEVVLAGNVLGTQWWNDDALMAAFGIEFGDLENYPYEGGNGRRSFTIDPVKSIILERIEEIRAERP